jgi:hypothetical protein
MRMTLSSAPIGCHQGWHPSLGPDLKKVSSGCICKQVFEKGQNKKITLISRTKKQMGWTSFSFTFACCYKTKKRTNSTSVDYG